MNKSFIFNFVLTQSSANKQNCVSYNVTRQLTEFGLQLLSHIYMTPRIYMVNNFKESHNMIAIDIVYVTHFSLFLDDKNFKKKVLKMIKIIKF
jgi:hypothetical protein